MPIAFVVISLFSPPSVNVVNIGGNCEIGRSVRRFVCVCSSVCWFVCLFVHMYFEAPCLHNGARLTRGHNVVVVVVVVVVMFKLLYLVEICTLTSAFLLI